MENKINSKSEGIILILSDLLKQLSEKKEILDVLKEYYLLENTYIGLIKKQQFGTVITQKKLYSLMIDFYYYSNNIKKLNDRTIAEKNIKKAFYSFLLSPNFVTIIDKLYADESELMYEMDKFSIIKGIHKTLSDKVIKTIQNTTSYNIVPNFIIYYDKKLLNSKINDIIKHKYLFNYTDKNQSTIEYKYLTKYFFSFSKNPNIIFSKDIFNEEFRKNFFKLIILCNYKYLKNNENAYKQFKERIINNIILMKLDEYCKELNEEFELIMNKEEKIIDEDFEKLKNEIKAELFGDKNDKNKNNINNSINILNSYNNIIENLNKKYLILIFSLSALFNRIVIIKNKNAENKEDKEDKENKEDKNNINNKENIININNVQYEIKIISKLKCSAINRQFLLNILNIFEEENVFVYNYIIDSYILSDIIKIDSRQLFQKTRTKEKIIFYYKDILEKLKQKGIFNIFYNENKKIFTQPIINIGFFGNLFNKQMPNSIKTGTGKELYYNINELKLFPIMRGEIYSTQITIVIDGPLSTDIQFETNDNSLSHKDIFCTFFTNNIYTNSDFYLYDWQSMNYKEIARIKKISKFYGKLLAYIIATREIFTFQTINLVGYSMGCNVIKYCLLELNKINKKMNCFDIINNVIFIGGCVNIKIDKNPEIFEGVAGKIINIFSKVDKDLIQYNKNAIGLKEIEIPKEFEKKYQIINFDLSKKNIRQDDYFYQLPNILFKNAYLH